MARIEDVDAAIAVVDEWIARIDERRSIQYPKSEEAAAFKDWFTSRVTIVQQIAAAVLGSQWATSSFHAYAGGTGSIPWLGTRDAAVRVRGALATSQEAAQLFQKSGPRLSAAALHPWVWDGARHLWGDGHHRSAVANAAAMVETMLRERLQRFDVSGAKLVGEAFSLSPPTPGRSRLRLVGIPTDPENERWRSAHLGAMHLGQGCFEGIRNWAAHSVESAEEQVALEYLAALSVFARWVDGSRVEDSSDTSAADP